MKLCYVVEVEHLISGEMSRECDLKFVVSVIIHNFF
jgi:hypothetical protein